MTPVHAITDLAYRLTLVPNLAGVVSPDADDDATGYQIEGCTLHLCYVEVSEQSKRMLSSNHTA